MKNKDFLIVAFAPFALLWIPLVGVTSGGWAWTRSDFVVMWCILAGTTFFYRLLATRKWSNPTYRLGAGLAVGAGFLLTWVNLAVQVIGDDNPGNLFYFLIILGGMIGVGLSRFQAANLAKVAFAMAAALPLAPVVAVLAWPADFNPGFPQVLLLSSCFALMFAVSGLLFRHAARQGGGASAALA